VGLAVLLACLALVAVRVAWFDPYWVFRRTPPWTEVNGGQNRLLDRQMRRAKSLQAMTRPYDVALLGSSTTYHGLDPSDADPGPRIYNAGISGILADELPTMASIVASRDEMRRVALGLDYYMFSRTDRAVRLDPSLATSLGRANALMGALVGRYAIHDAWESEVGAATDPGRWTYDGFRITPKLAPELTRMNDTIRRRTTVALQPATYGSIERVLTVLGGRDVTLYLAPVSRAQRRVLSELGHLGDFDRWREDMRALAERCEVRFHDLTALGSEDAFDPETGSTDLWLDNLHYTPLIGRHVLAAIGLRSRP
jgi:hypothetical protein